MNPVRNCGRINLNILMGKIYLYNLTNNKIGNGFDRDLFLTG